MREKSSLYRCAIFGIIVGSILYIYIKVNAIDTKENLYIKNVLYAITQMSYHQTLQIIIKKRIFQMAMLILLLYIIPFKIILYSLAIGISSYYSFFMSRMFCDYGIYGLGIGIFCFFPHFIFYTLAVGGIYQILYGYRKNRKETRRKGECLRISLRFFGIVIIFVMGLLCEVILPKNIFAYFYQHIVW